MPTLLTLGGRWPDWSGPASEGPRLALNIEGPPLLGVLWRAPIASEVHAFRYAPMRFGLLATGHHTLFLLIHVPGLFAGWADAPFALGMHPPDQRAIPRPEPGHGWLVHTVLADAMNGNIAALRLLTWSPPFSQALADLLAGQAGHLAEFSRARHHAEIAAAYQRYPTSDAMAAGAALIETGGARFPRADSH